MCITVTLSPKKLFFVLCFSIAILKVFFVLTLCFPSSSIIDLLWKGKVSFYWATSTKLWKLSFFFESKQNVYLFFFARLFFNAWSVYTLYHDISYIDNFDINNLCSEVTALTLSYGTFHQIVSNKCNLFSGSSIKGKYSVLRETNFPVVLLLWFPPNPDVWWIQVCWMDPNDFGGILTTSWISPIVPR